MLALRFFTRSGRPGLGFGLSIFALLVCTSVELPGAATTPNPGLRYYYAAPHAPVVDIEADIVVYGGTSGGVVAAVQAARLGKSVALVVFGRHVGGMTSGGLTSTDGVNSSVQGGLTREFFNRTGNTGFRPSKAEAEFERLLADPVPGVVHDKPVPVYYEQRLAAVEREGARIVALHMENGSVFRGRMFIDCSYEGDLLAYSGVDYTVGREAATTYGESRAGRSGLSAILTGVDPYVVPGDPGSGLIHGVLDEPQGTNGVADDHVQAYNFRMFTVRSANAANRRPYWRPAGHESAMHELLYRFLRSGGSTAMTFGNDINNHEMFARRVSTDYVGGSKNWPDGDYAEREAIFQAHVRWQFGMLWYLRNDARVRGLAVDPSLSAGVRGNITTLLAAIDESGLPLDEYPETAGWPHELYVREARRMVSDLVLTQAHYDRTVVEADSVGLANYSADSHDARRIVVFPGGVPTVANEGDTGGALATPWRIPYRALTPRREQCENLLVTWALSASHVAFCSTRMEPVLMVLSQSAASAASLAIDRGAAVQDVEYGALRLHLIAGGQILGAEPAATGEVILDNDSPAGVSVVGSWLTSAATTGYWGGNYLHDNNAVTGGGAVRYRPVLPSAGTYEVFARWTSYANRATNTPVDVVHANGTTTLVLDQTRNGGVWVSLGSHEFAAGSTGGVDIRNDGATGYVIADAVRFIRASASPGATVQIVATVPVARETDGAPATVHIVRDAESTSAPLMVSLIIGGDATPGVDYVALPAQVTIPTGARAAVLTVTPLEREQANGARSVTITVGPGGAGYLPGERSSATVTVVDKPYDTWRHAFFSARGEANSPSSLGEADPDGDGSPNRLEFFFGTDPLGAASAQAEGLRVVATEGGGLVCEYRRSGAAKDLNGIVEYAHELGAGSWAPVATSPQTIGYDAASGDRWFRVPLATGETGRCFVRLRLP